MIFLSIFICFYLFFFRRQRRNFLYLTHVKTSSCGTIERIERKSRLARRVGECPAGEIVQIFSKSFKFISRQNDSNPINPPNLLNHRGAVCLLYKQVPAERLSRLNGFIIFDHEFHEFHELGEPWRLLGNHPDGAFAKKAKNSLNSSNS